MKQVKPNKARLRKWVDALRSRKYKQAGWALNAGKNLRCCLGVACDVYIQANPKLKLEWVQELNDYYSFLNEQGKLPGIIYISTGAFPLLCASVLIYN